VQQLAPTTQQRHGHVRDSVYRLHYSYFTNPTTITPSAGIIKQFIALNSRQFLPKKLNITGQNKPARQYPS
jgi:hypothetical protein